MIVVAVIVGEDSHCLKQYVQFTKTGKYTK